MLATERLAIRANVVRGYAITFAASDPIRLAAIPDEIQALLHRTEVVEQVA